MDNLSDTPPQVTLQATKRQPSSDDLDPSSKTSRNKTGLEVPLAESLELAAGSEKGSDYESAQSSVSESTSIPSSTEGDGVVSVLTTIL